MFTDVMNEPNGIAAATVLALVRRTNFTFLASILITILHSRTKLL
jgi:hypothetical protein